MQVKESLASSGSSSRQKRQKTSDIEDYVAGEEGDSASPSAVYQNPPVVSTVFRDPDTEEDKVLVVASLHGGASDVEFSLVGSGPGTTAAVITYNWPKLSFDTEGI